MKRLFLPTILILTLTLAACSALPSSSPTPLPTVALDSPSPNESSADGFTASGVVVPLRKAQLSCPSIGRTQCVDVSVREMVNARNASMVENSP